jgi:hypothetical protein
MSFVKTVVIVRFLSVDRGGASAPEEGEGQHKGQQEEEAAESGFPDH